MIKLKSLIREELGKVSLGPLKLTIRQVDMYYMLYKLEDGTILAYPKNQSRLFSVIDKFGIETVLEPLTNAINSKYGEGGLYKMNCGDVDVTKPITYIFIKNT